MIVFFFNDTATTEIYTLSLHDALPIWPAHLVAEERQVRQRPHDGAVRPHEALLGLVGVALAVQDLPGGVDVGLAVVRVRRSEEHTSELQSRQYLVCRLLLEKKKKTLLT